MIRGAQTQVEASPPNPLVVALLCCHGLECILKAYLAVHVDTHTLKAHNVRHNLVALWDLAEQHGLPLPAPRPSWLQGLSDMHDVPYQLRYAQGLHGIVFPPLGDIPGVLATLREQVLDVQRTLGASGV